MISLPRALRFSILAASILCAWNAHGQVVGTPPATAPAFPLRDTRPQTGTGQVLGGVQAGYNDIGVITGPDGHSYAMAVMIRRSSAPLQQRMRAMQNVVHAVIGYHDSLERSGDFAGYSGGGRGGRR